MSKVFFPGLNSLRFMAATLVVLTHLEQMRGFWGIGNFLNISESVGSLSVTFFFVLSGFLITYLLIKEKEKFQTIDVPKFYMRRILRIWPVYFLVVLLAFFVLPYLPAFDMPGTRDEMIHEHYWRKFTCFILIVPNIGAALNYSAAYIAQLWSIGVEEQFYLIWPLLIRKFNRYTGLMLAIIILGFLFRNGFAYLSSHATDPFQKDVYHFLNMLWIRTRFGSMAIGGIGALLIYRNYELVTRFLLNRYVEVITFAVIVASLVLNVYIPFLQHEFYSVLFCILIMNISCNPRALLQFENKVWAFMGNISYGIYMYHYIIIQLVLYVFVAYLKVEISFATNLMIFVTTLFLTFLVAGASYHYFEIPFLRLKDKFAKIKSGNAVSKAAEQSVHVAQPVEASN